MENNLPVVYLVDSAGVYLPMQDEVFPDKEHFGRIFRNNAKMSAMGIVQLSAIMGSCVAGGAYLPIMSDYAFIVEGTGSVFLAGSYLVKSSIGEEVDNETFGGATMHSEISGVTDNKYPNDQSCLDAIRKVVDKLGHKAKAGFDRKVICQRKSHKNCILFFLKTARSLTTCWRLSSELPMIRSLTNTKNCMARLFYAA